MKIERLEIAGFMAAAATVAAFLCGDTPTLRMFAISANVLFLVYGVGLSHLPVIALHGALLPLNAARLAGCMQGRPVEFEVRAGGKARATP